MKKLLYILLFVCIALFGQNDCELPNQYTNGSTGGGMTVFLGAEFISGLNFISPNPYIVAISSSNLVIGSACLAPDCLINGMQSFVVWGDDDFTNDVIEGALEGESISLQIVDGIYLYELNSLSYMTYGTLPVFSGEMFYQCSAQPVTGCTDIQADNYSVESNIDDGSCYYFGCTDSTSFNYNSSATVDDGNCIGIVYGCTDITAFNFDLQANVEDSSCVTLEEYIIDSLQTELEELNQESTTSISSLQQALDTWNTTIDLNAGWNMFGYGCPSSIDVVDGLSNHTESIIITKDNNGNVYMPEFGFNGIGDFTPGFGYQIKLTEAIEGFSLCDWYVNDIPEDNIVSLQEELIELQELNADIILSNNNQCVEYGYCGYNIDILACYHPEFGLDCSGDSLDLYFGQETYGGIVFYIDESESRGLVIAKEPIVGDFEWGCYEYEVNNTQAEIGTGLQNTLVINSHGCETENGEISAVQAVMQHSYAGYNDWFLPSLDELNEVYLKIGGGAEIGNIGMYINNHCWTSTEADILTSKSYNLLTGNIGGWDPKNWERLVYPVRAFGYTLGCMDSVACNYNPEANMGDGSCTYLELGYDCDGNINVEVGVEAFGGIVFYIDEASERGLVAANEDLPGVFEWGCNNIYFNGALNSFLGSGQLNTQEIINNNCTTQGTYSYDAFGIETNSIGITAAQKVTNEIIAGYDDWYLPSIDELQHMYSSIGQGSSIGNIGNFQDNSYAYWSSTQIDEIHSWSMGFGTGEIGNGDKYGVNKIRPIRAFGNWIMGCMDETACNYNSDANMADGSCEYPLNNYDCEGNIIEYFVGMEAEGGIVFYIDETGYHGLVAAMEDLTEDATIDGEGTPGYQWGCFAMWLSGADGQAIGTGYQNTLDIVSGCSETPIAASEALAYQLENYSDWYLPSLDELKEMYYTIGNGGSEGNIGGFSSNWYWSSSESNNYGAYDVNFSDGSTGNFSSKTKIVRVRPIRSF